MRCRHLTCGSNATRVPEHARLALDGWRLYTLDLSRPPNLSKQHHSDWSLYTPARDADADRRSKSSDHVTKCMQMQTGCSGRTHCGSGRAAAARGVNKPTKCTPALAWLDSRGRRALQLLCVLRLGHCGKLQPLGLQFQHTGRQGPPAGLPAGLLQNLHGHYAQGCRQQQPGSGIGCSLQKLCSCCWPPPKSA